MASMRFYTVEKIGETQALTPEGFLVCRDVPLARTGTMIYGPNEVPVTAGADGLVRIHREEDEVFRPEYMASLEGKSVANDHPPEDIRPDNWKEYHVGSMLNVRRGTGAQGDLLIGDLLIMDPSAIEDVKAGKREVSLGYDADYEEIGPGEGRQLNLVGNHVALVDAGRCGSRCAIGDKQQTEGALKMAKKLSWADRVRKAFNMKDSEALEKALEEGESVEDEGSAPEGADTHIHIHANGGPGDTPEEPVQDDDLEGFMTQNAADHEEFRKRLAAIEAKLEMGGDPAEDEAIEGELEEEAPVGTGDRARKARDSEFLGDSFQETVALAEILAPGIRIPTYDRAANPKKMLDAICGLRRNALDLAYATPEGRGMIEDINGKPLELSGMKCNQVRTLFRAAAAMKKSANNRQGSNDRDKTAAGMGVKGAVRTPAELNARMKALYEKQ